MTQAMPTETRNAAAERLDNTLLSILVPFYGDDPSRLAAALNLAAGGRKDIELVLFDDGSADRELNAAVMRTIKALSMPARVMTSARNLGRSEARNALAQAARGRWFLFLDADMSPSSGGFLEAYLDEIERDTFDAAFGGYETATTLEDPYSLHAALSAASDKSDAALRSKTGVTAFCSSNLLVRASVLRDVPFDAGFTGWGWEDVDWAVRAARVYRLVHLDNPARHGGLQTPDALLRKFKSGATNYARLLAKHPQLAQLPGARAARTLSRIPFQRKLRAMWSALARNARMPMRLRTLAVKLWRASWTAEAI